MPFFDGFSIGSFISEIYIFCLCLFVSYEKFQLEILRVYYELQESSFFLNYEYTPFWFKLQTESNVTLRFENFIHLLYCSSLISVFLKVLLEGTITLCHRGIVSYLIDTESEKVLFVFFLSTHFYVLLLFYMFFFLLWRCVVSMINLITDALSQLYLIFERKLLFVETMTSILRTTGMY